MACWCVIAHRASSWASDLAALCPRAIGELGHHPVPAAMLWQAGAGGQTGLGLDLGQRPPGIKVIWYGTDFTPITARSSSKARESASCPTFCPARAPG